MKSWKPATFAHKACLYLSETGVLSSRLHSPIFIVGCGRSGTTFVGRILASHEDVIYFNEPRWLWTRVFPETDIWSRFAIQRSGRLYLEEKDVPARKKRKLRSLFFTEALIQRIRHGKRPWITFRLVEKTPINAFRIRFLHALFPDARFVHVIRDGRVVARSISERASSGWYGAAWYKWNKLIEYAKTQGYGDLIHLVASNYQRGLLEWTLAVETAQRDLRKIQACSFELKYECLLANPEGVVSELLRFCGLRPEKQVLQFAISQMRPSLRSIPRLTPIDAQLAGRVLQRLGYISV